MELRRPLACFESPENGALSKETERKDNYIVYIILKFDQL